jgi:DNA-binding MarR family transcriptional regulator
MTASNYHHGMCDEARHLLGQTILRLDPGRLEQWAAIGLTMTQLRVLFLLRLEDGLAAGALAEKLNVTPPTLTRIMDRLVRNQLVKRAPDEEDRRLVRHCLTARGEDMVEELQRMGRARLNEIFATLSEEKLACLVEALRDLAAAIEAADEAQAAVGA